MTKPTPRTSSNPLRSRFLTALQALLALALLAVATLALTAPAVSPAPAHAETDFWADDFATEEVDEEGEEEAWESEEEEGEEGELDPETDLFLPPECVLRTAEPTVTAQFGNGSLRLSLRYTADEPVKVGVSYWLKGGKGSLRLRSVTRRLNRQGVLHLSSRLDDRGVAKARAARATVVDLDVPAAPSGCEPYLTMHLNAKDLTRSRATWSARPGS